MGKPPKRKELPDRIRGLIKFKARQLVGNYGLTEDDREDIEQHVVEFLWPRLDRFDPDKGSLKSFIDQVIKKAIGRFIEHRFAQMRSPWREKCSLDESVRGPDGSETPRGEMMDANEGARRLGRRHVHFTDRADLAADLAEIRSRLPEDLKPLWDELKISLPAEAARRMNIPPSTLYERRKLMQRFCEDTGLEEYL